MLKNSLRFFPSPQMINRSCRLFTQQISDYSQFLKILQHPPAPCLVGVFSARHSLAAKMFKPAVLKVAEKFPGFHFFDCDVDTVPKAAYDCEIAGDFQVAVCPVGRFTDGRLSTKEDWRVLGTRDLNDRLEQVLRDLDLAEAGERKIEFDPNTGCNRLVQ